MHKTRSCVSFCAAFSIALVVVAACLIVLLSQKDKANTEAVAETVGKSQESQVEGISNTVNSSSEGEANSTHKNHHHRQRQFCRKCCHTPPCWYNNHKECSKCVKKEQLELHVTRLLRRSHKKAMQHHRRTEKSILKQ